MFKPDLYKWNARLTRVRWGLKANRTALQTLKIYSRKYRFSIATGDLLFMEQSWYVTHAGLLRLCVRRRCSGIEVQPVAGSDDCRGVQRSEHALAFRRGREASQPI